MSRAALVVFTLSCCLPADDCPAEQFTSRFETAWVQLVNAQLSAADAEIRLRQLELAAIGQLHRDGGLADDERQRCRTQAAQAAKWAAVLREQHELFDQARPLPEPERVEARLRVPGIPLAFADDSLTTVAVPQNTQTLQVMKQIQTLLAVEEPAAERMVPGESVPGDAVIRVHPAPATGQTGDSDRQMLELRASEFDPMAFEAFLLRPVRWDAVPAGNSQAADGNATAWARAARQWIRLSRQLFRDQLETGHGPGGDAAGVDHERIEAARSHLEHELNLVGLTGRESSEEALNSQERAALLMRMSKSAHDDVQRELSAVREDIQTLTLNINRLSAAAEEPASASSELRLLREQLAVAALVENRLHGEVRRRRAVIRYAMAVYRLRTGKDAGVEAVRQERLNVFTRATELRPDLKLVALQIDLVAQQLGRLQSLPSQGLAVAQEVHRLETQLAMLKAEQRGLETRIAVAQLCLKLLRLSDAEPAVALN